MSCPVDFPEPIFLLVFGGNKISHTMTIENLNSQDVFSFSRDFRTYTCR